MMNITQYAGGYLRLSQIIGRDAVTEEQAAQNRELALTLEEGSKVRTGPRKARPALPALIPVSRSTFYNGVKTGRFPKPVKGVCDRASLWRASEVLAFINGGESSK